MGIFRLILWLSQVEMLNQVGFAFCPKTCPSAAPWDGASFGVIFFQIRHFFGEPWSEHGSESGWTGLSTRMDCLRCQSSYVDSPSM